MAMQLSRRGWNNVLIFAVLGFICVFQLSQQGLLERQPERSAPVPDTAVIMEIRFDETLIQRIGNGWRSPQSAWNEAQIEQWLRLLQTALPTREIVEQPAGVPIQLLLLGESEPLVLLWQPQQSLLHGLNQSWGWQLADDQVAIMEHFLLTDHDN